jgi:transposase
MEETPPLDLTLEEWAATPPRVRAAFQMLLAMVAELPTLQTRVAELEARLNQNSQNSSKPPSSGPPSAPPPPTKTPRGKPKKQGAQPGHPEQQRELLPEAEVDKVVAVHPTCCPNCHDMLPATLGSACLPLRQQVWELPEVWPTITEFQYLTVCCRGCGELVTAPRPDDVPPGAFGPRVVALIALLHGRYRISDRELVVLLQMVWHLPISLGSVVNLQQVASAALAPAHAEVQEAVTSSEQANVDETSWHEGQKKPWLWVAVTSLAVLFRVQYGRGRAQLALLLGTVFAGLVTSDRLSAYNSIEVARRQLCLAHLVRNFRGPRHVAPGRKRRRPCWP